MGNRFESMPFNRPNSKFEKKEEKEGVEKFLAQYAADLREEGFSVDDKCRIDEQKFADIKGKELVSSDLKNVEEISKNFEKDPAGEKLEQLKTASLANLFKGSKGKASNFVVMRTSRYDDVKHGVDNIIIHKPSKSIVCAFDETLIPKAESSIAKDFSGGLISKKGMEKQSLISNLTENWNNLYQRLVSSEKKNKFEKANIWRDGVELKYGFDLSGEEPKQATDIISELPLVLLCADEGFVNNGYKNFRDGQGKHSEEKRLGFAYHFLNEIIMQGLAHFGMTPDEAAEEYRLRLEGRVSRSPELSKTEKKFLEFFEAVYKEVLP